MMIHHLSMAHDARLLGGIDVLAAVVEAGSFVRAARALGLTQSGVSRAVARLEAQLGVRLFDRNARSVVLTDEGRRFHHAVTPLLAGISEAAREAAGVGARARPPARQPRPLLRAPGAGAAPRPLPRRLSRARARACR